MHISLTAVILLLFFYSCKSQKTEGADGKVVEVKSEIYMAGPAPPFTTSFLIWYRDSFAIEEIKTIYFNSDSKNVPTRVDKIMHYTFIDLRLHTLYDYSSFSDTAKLIKKYWQPDSMYVDGGTNFYYAGKKFRDTPQPLMDTIINHVVYKRIMFNSVEHNPEKVYSIGYLRCDMGTSIFSGEKPYCDSLGCNMTRVEAFAKKNNDRLMTSEFDFIRDTLSFEENKVFDAWQKNTLSK